MVLYGIDVCDKGVLNVDYFICVYGSYKYRVSIKSRFFIVEVYFKRWFILKCFLLIWKNYGFF